LMISIVDRLLQLRYQGIHRQVHAMHCTGIKITSAVKTPLERFLAISTIVKHHIIRSERGCLKHAFLLAQDLLVLAAILLLWDDDKVVGAVRINLDLAELACRNTILEEDV